LERDLVRAFSSQSQHLLLVDGSWKNPNCEELAKTWNNGSFTLPTLPCSLKFHPSPFLGMFLLFSTLEPSFPSPLPLNISTRELE
jgi:hypothetical protein